MNRRILYAALLNFQRPQPDPNVATTENILENAFNDDDRDQDGLFEQFGLNIGGITVWRRGRTLYWQKGWGKEEWERLWSTARRDPDDIVTVEPRFFMTFRPVYKILPDGTVKEKEIRLHQNGKMRYVVKKSFWSVRGVFKVTRSFFRASNRPAQKATTVFSIPTLSAGVVFIAIFISFATFVTTVFGP